MCIHIYMLIYIYIYVHIYIVLYSEFIFNQHICIMYIDIFY